MAPADPDHAERLAKSLLNVDDRTWALAKVAQAAAATHPDIAERIANLISKKDERASALADVVRAAAAAYPDVAERIATSIADISHKEYALVAVASAVAAIDPYPGECIAWSISAPRRQAKAIAAVAKSIEAVAPDRAAALISQLTETAWQLASESKTNTLKAARGQADLTEAIASELPDLAEQFACSCIELSRQIPDTEDKSGVLRTLSVAVKSIIEAHS
jgi:hypothetical protein